MKDGKLSSEDRISRRSDFFNSIEYWISESVYYRSNSIYFNDSDKIVLQSIGEDESKTKVI